MSDNSNRKVIRIAADAEEQVRQYAEEKGIGVGEAADALIKTAVSRLNALKRYAKNKEPQAPGKPRKKAAKKAKAPKKSLANGVAAHA